MSLQDRLYNASFKGVAFIFKQRTTEINRKIITHDYIYSNKRDVEDLGAYPVILKYEELTISNSNEDVYLRQKQAMEHALHSAGVGDLIDPYYGPIKAVVKTASVTESIDSFYKSVYSVVFESVPVEISPSPTTSFTEIVQKQDDLLSVLSLNLTDNFNANTPNAINTGIKQLSGLEPWVQEASNTAGVDLSLSLVSSFNSLAQNMVAYIRNPSALGPALNDIIKGCLYNNASEIIGYNFNQLLFGFDPIAPALGKSNSVITINQNIDYINNYVNLAFLSNAYLLANQLTYGNNLEIDQVNDALDSRYAILTSKTNLDDDAISYLDQIRALVKKNLDNLRLNIATVLTIEVAPTSLSLVSYKYYGTYAREDELLALNDGIIENPAIVEGEIRILSE